MNTRLTSFDVDMAALCELIPKEAEALEAAAVVLCYEDTDKQGDFDRAYLKAFGKAAKTYNVDNDECREAVERALVYCFECEAPAVAEEVLSRLKNESYAAHVEANLIQFGANY